MNQQISRTGLLVKKQLILCMMILAVLAQKATAQDPHFSQFFEAPLLRNPSLAGIFEGDVRVQGVYRSQWGSVTVPYQTVSLNAEYKQPIGGENDFITAGLQLLSDKAGTIDFTTTEVLPVINYHKALSGDKLKYLSLGFMGGWVQRRIDRSKMTTNNQFDGSTYNASLSNGENFAQTSYGYLDGSVGMSFNSSIAGRESDNYFVGLAYHHFNRPKHSFYKNPSIEMNPKWEFSSGVRLTVNEASFFTLYGNYSRQGRYTETIIGGLYAFKLGSNYERPDYVLHLGALTRWGDAFIPVVKMDYHPFSLVFSYDASISQLKTASVNTSAFEVSVAYAGFLNRNNSARNAVLCPRF